MLMSHFFKPKTEPGLFGQGDSVFFQRTSANTIGSMYGIFTYIYRISKIKEQPNVGKYTITWMVWEWLVVGLGPGGLDSCDPRK